MAPVHHELAVDPPRLVAHLDALNRARETEDPGAERPRRLAADRMLKDVESDPMPRDGDQPSRPPEPGGARPGGGDHEGRLPMGLEAALALVEEGDAEQPLSRQDRERAKRSPLHEGLRAPDRDPEQG